MIKVGLGQAEGFDTLKAIDTAIAKCKRPLEGYQPQAGIVFTGMTLILPILTWYFISALKFQAQMGFFLAMLLFTNMVAALTLHPLMVLLFKPKFMQVGVVEVENVVPLAGSQEVLKGE